MTGSVMSGEDKQEVCLRAVTIITDLRDFDKEVLACGLLE